MQRLRDRYPDAEKISVLVNQTEELLLLLDNRHVRFEKTDLSFIDNHSVKIDIKEPTAADVVRALRPLFVDIHSTDIESITETPGGYRIVIKDTSFVYHGSFKIKFRDYNLKES